MPHVDGQEAGDSCVRFRTDRERAGAGTKPGVRAGDDRQDATHDARDRSARAARRRDGGPRGRRPLLRRGGPGRHDAEPLATTPADGPHAHLRRRPRRARRVRDRDAGRVAHARRVLGHHGDGVPAGQPVPAAAARRAAGRPAHAGEVRGLERRPGRRRRRADVGDGPAHPLRRLRRRRAARPPRLPRRRVLGDPLGAPHRTGAAQRHRRRLRSRRSEGRPDARRAPRVRPCRRRVHRRHPGTPPGADPWVETPGLSAGPSRTAASQPRRRAGRRLRALPGERAGGRRPPPPARVRVDVRHPEAVRGRPGARSPGPHRRDPGAAPQSGRDVGAVMAGASVRSTSSRACSRSSRCRPCWWLSRSPSGGRAAGE